MSFVFEFLQQFSGSHDTLSSTLAKIQLFYIIANYCKQNKHSIFKPLQTLIF